MRVVEPESTATIIIIGWIRDVVRASTTALVSERSMRASNRVEVADEDMKSNMDSEPISSIGII